MAQLPDIGRSRAILVGTGRYQVLSELGAVHNNVSGLADTLQDERIWGLPSSSASPRTGHLPDALSRACDTLRFPQATGHDEVFRQFVLARIIEPTSKQDSLRVLDEAGAPAPSYPTLNRRRPAWAEQQWR